MIARTWHGRVLTVKADACQAFLYRTGIRDDQSTPGNRGVLALRQTNGDETHFLLTTLWERCRMMDVDTLLTCSFGKPGELRRHP